MSHAPKLFFVSCDNHKWTNRKNVESASIHNGSIFIKQCSGQIWCDCLGSRVTLDGEIGILDSYMICNSRCVSWDLTGIFESLPVKLTEINRDESGHPNDYLYVGIRSSALLETRVSDAVRFGFARPGSKTLFADPDTWDGSDLAVDQAGANFYCSLDFVERARTDRWTGFSFWPADLPYEELPVWDGIDYLGEVWPPRRWYPPDPAAFSGVTDWVAAFDEAKSSYDQYASVMIREHECWSSQEAIDWLASYITENPSGIWRVDNAARVYSKFAFRYPDLYRYDQAALKLAHDTARTMSTISTAALRKRYGI